MTRKITAQEIRQEGRLLFALLDAINAENLISGTDFQSRWRALKTRVDSGAAYEAEAEELYDLLVEIARTRAIDGTWIEKRWRSADARIRGDNHAI
jgi:hypothetical protein